MKCRHCESNLTLTLIDLGTSPPSNAYLTETKLHEPEKWFPLRVLVCENCWLVQTEDFASANELFDSEYAYFSGYSSSWLEHSKNYVTQMISRFNLNKESHVVEIAANDGYLLQFVKAHNIPCTGIEPTTSTANAARQKGIEIVEDFFGVRLAEELVKKGKQADLTAANNVLAHVPDINDFVSGFSLLLKPDGVATFEFPHLMQLVNQNQFDTIYHEHFSYLSFIAVNRIFSANGLNIFDVEELPTHGGSLRVFAQRSDTGKRVVSERVDELLKIENNLQMNSASYYQGLQLKAEKVKNDLLEFLIKAKKQGKKVAAYGAAAKGNTLLNFAGIRHDLISFVVDKNPSKQGKFLPGNRIPIVDEEVLESVKPDYVIILPWNLKDEVIQQLNASGNRTNQYVIAIPDLTIL
ncbi:methyltransferase domain-containing protein [Leptospira bourretii]|uniref:Methyltransferase domain-containing protein n=1 Tax=Leptospira bourretii TaxID=2484962 RepID=A0A4R9ILQ0_9LEPT|nr:class I SAM-dependent methyltransferase [Leptospira bourretii]TGK79427.1 methyltransferase domain-containing protein [Leptospira bourretii]TGK89634.1 methyltransferase domain-containing protein [Leptospira bourretii]TGL26854.1 methyltransferase domain-containing protein [Leptospira bourretii]